MARGAPTERPEERLVLRFADGTQHRVDLADAAAVLRGGYAVPAPFVRSRRVFDMIVEYAEKHEDYTRRGVRAERDIHDWDDRFMDRVGDTDALHDLFLASAELEVNGLMKLCAEMTADMIKGRPVEVIRTLLGITDVVLTPEQEHKAQRDHDRLLSRSR